MLEEVVDRPNLGQKRPHRSKDFSRLNRAVLIYYLYFGVFILVLHTLLYLHSVVK